jgi:hypothetical protein
MGVSRYFVLSLTMLVASGLAACFSPAQQRDEATTIGSSGGTVQSPAGARIDVPAGAVSKTVSIKIAATELAAVPGYQIVGTAFLAEPADLTFAQSVTITVPYDEAQAGSAEVRVATAPGASTDFVLLDSTQRAADVSASAPRLGLFVAVTAVAVPGRDAGRECAIPAAGYCVFHPEDLAPQACAWKSPCSFDGNITSDLSCSGTSCTCEIRGDLPTVDTKVDWNGDCSPENYRLLWTCGCGFPALVDAPPCPDAGMDTGMGAPLGGACVHDPDCSSGMCYGSFCSRACSSAAPCPCGFACTDDAHCWPLR